MNSEKVNAAINQLNAAQGNLRKHDAIRAIEAGNYAEAIEILLDEGVDGYRLAVGSDQVRAIAEARKALYEALTENSEPVTVEAQISSTAKAEQTYEDYVAIMDACDMTPEPRERWEVQQQNKHEIVTEDETISAEEIAIEIEQWQISKSVAIPRIMMQLLTGRPTATYMSDYIKAKPMLIEDGLLNKADNTLTEKGEVYAKYFSGIFPKPKITPYKGGRTEQLHTRITPESKVLLENAAKERGVTVADIIEALAQSLAR